MATPAFAQSGAPTAVTSPGIQKTANPDLSATTTGGASFVSAEQSSDWRGSKLIGATVYGSNNASIGEINDVVIGSDARINAVVIGVGGFLGVGEKNVAVPFDKLQVSRKPASASIDKITVSFTKDELKAAPTFAYYDPEKSATTGSAAPSRDSAPLSNTAPAAPKN
ncbi:MAG TPA: PRC-barrel domain-containing protein [Rhizomicrobium sp.]